MAHLIHALYTYHTDEQPSMTVLQASQKVMAELRQLLVPPTNKPVPEKIAEINGKTLSAKRAVTRTPARPKRTTARVVSDSKAATKPIQTTARGVSVSKISPVAEITVKFDDVARLSDLFCELAQRSESIALTVIRCFVQLARHVGSCVCQNRSAQAAEGNST